MISTLRRLFKCATGTAAVEAAIFLPIFLTFTLGVTDLGSGMFTRMSVNAAAQAGAAYAVINSGSVCVYPMSSTCSNAITAAMNDATGNSLFCTGTTVCTPAITKPCADGSPECITVTASYTYSPIIPIASGIFSQTWTKSMTVSSTTTIRVQ
jgi:Flp pilus assembly protein TadG